MFDEDPEFGEEWMGDEVLNLNQACGHGCIGWVSVEPHLAREPDCTCPGRILMRVVTEVETRLGIALVSPPEEDGAGGIGVALGRQCSYAAEATKRVE